MACLRKTGTVSEPTCFMKYLEIFLSLNTLLGNTEAFRKANSLMI